MNIISATVLRNNLADAISEITSKKDYLLVAKRGEISSVLVNIELFEDLLSLSDKKYLESIKKAREEYEKGEVLSHNQAFGEV